MNQTHIEDSELQRFFDGDLPADQASEVQRAMDTDAALRARFAQLERLQQLMRMSAEQALDEVGFEGMYANIQAGIAADCDSAGHGSEENGSVDGHGWARIVAWFRARWAALTEGRAQLWMPVAGTAAVAAAVLLMFYAPQRETMLERPTLPSEGREAVGPGARPGQVARHSEVVTVDFGTSTGSVFEIDLAEGGSTPVVWINDG
jgi:hypothetical protein